MNKHKKSGSAVITVILLIVFSGVFLFSACKVFSNLYETKKSRDAYAQLRAEASEQNAVYASVSAAESAGADQNAEEAENFPEPGRRFSINVSALRESYPGIKAWITAEGTEIDYPVVQAGDNDYYLTHLYNGSPNPNGAIFMDYRNSGVFTDDITAIYGHNMNNGSMFHTINKYKSQEYYEAHPTMIITTEDGDYLVELIAGVVENGNYEFEKFVFDDFEDMETFAADIRARSVFESPLEITSGDRLVTLCTCTYERDNARYMLLGKVSPIYETE